MREIRRILAPQDQEAVFNQTASALLDEEGRSVPDWEIVGPQIENEIGQQSGQLLAGAARFRYFRKAPHASCACVRAC